MKAIADLEAIADIEESGIEEVDSFGSSASFDLRSATGESKHTPEKKEGSRERGLKR